MPKNILKSIKSQTRNNLVSIIIPHFNRSLLLKEAVDSVKKQTYKSWEIIIVDDGSEYDEWFNIQAYQEENIKIFRRTDGVKGPSRCRNIGVSKARGKYLIFLDSDDLLIDFCLQQRVAEMETDTNISMAVFFIKKFIQMPGDSNQLFNINVSLDKSVNLFLQSKSPWQTMAPIWKKKFFEKVGGFDEDLLFMEDPDLHLRALNFTAAKIKLCYDKPADCYYRINHIDKTKESFWFNSILYRIQFYKKLIGNNHNIDFTSQNIKDIKVGIYNLIKHFLYSRKNQFPDLYIDFLKWIKEIKLFSFFEITKLEVLIGTGNSSLWILRKLKMQGICFKLLPIK